MNAIASTVRNLTPRTLAALVGSILIVITLVISLSAVSAHASSQRDRMVEQSQQTPSQVLEHGLRAEDQESSRQISSILGL